MSEIDLCRVLFIFLFHLFIITIIIIIIIYIYFFLFFLPRTLPSGIRSRRRRRRFARGLFVSINKLRVCPLYILLLLLLLHSSADFEGMI